jgi:hypothetical protein
MTIFWFTKYFGGYTDAPNFNSDGEPKNIVFELICDVFEIFPPNYYLKSFINYKYI